MFIACSKCGAQTELTPAQVEACQRELLNNKQFMFKLESDALDKLFAEPGVEELMRRRGYKPNEPDKV